MNQYEVIRAKHTPENSTTISYEIFQQGLRVECVAILLFLFALADKASPQPMDIEQSVLAEELRLSKKAVLKSLGHLQEGGFVVREAKDRFVLPVSTITRYTLYLNAAEIEAWDNEKASQK
jgi:biotin operon repressor